ncbi:MAG: hypothetical protein ACKOGJ_01010 [Phycisphaerales bacterium]
MSRTAGRRRRTRRRRASALAGDPLDLFLDAITNALGVIMFILLMVVIFGRAGEEKSPEPRPDLREVQQLEERRQELLAKIQALPPAGDPELAARWKAALERVQRLEREESDLAVRARTADEKLRDAAARIAEERKTTERLAAEVEKAKSAVRSSASSFIRVSRFQQDKRKAVILTLSGGKLSRFRATADTKEISPPPGGSAVGDLEGARAAVKQALDAYPPSTHRVELIVWEGSFPQAKLVEQVLLELGYDSNPLPVRAGAAVPAGTGGVQ